MILQSYFISLLGSIRSYSNGHRFPQGVTGAGKTSLLDVLANRADIGTVTGDISIDGKMRDASFGRRIGYVQQEDIHLPTTTVREALEFSAGLRQPLMDKEYVDTVLRLLDMESYAEAIVGVPEEGLNVEQRRRLTIAVEMVAKPELLLFLGRQYLCHHHLKLGMNSHQIPHLDEPTSGLDSQTAWSICALLRKLADNGQAILCTLHQPSSQLFETFDRLLLLGKGGEQLYFGEIGPSGSAVIDYFESCGAPPCPPGANPAEWIIEITQAVADGSTKDGTHDGVKHWAERWHVSNHKQDIIRHLDQIKTSIGQKDSAPLEQYASGYAAPLSRQLLLVLKRNFQEYWRDPISLYSKFFLSIGVVSLISLLLPMNETLS